MEYRCYKVIALQKLHIENERQNLLSVIKDNTDCIEFISEPTGGAMRDPNSGRGVRKWTGGEIKVKFDENRDCHRALTDRLISCVEFNIMLKRTRLK